MKATILGTGIKLAIIMVLFVGLFATVSANHIVGFYADKNGYWSGGVKYYVHEISDVQFNVEDNGGDGLSLINGGVIVYYKNPNTGKDELVAVQCNQEELQNPDGICNNYDIVQNGKLAWAWDQKYYTTNQNKDDVNKDGQNDFVPAGKYYGIIITVPHKNYAAGTTQYETQTFVLDADDDGDAVPNGADKCPQTFGSGKGDALGCSDGDGDGVPDEKDKCLEKAETINGYLDSDGCPDELFAGGPPQGRFTCSAEECKQIQHKNEARREAQIDIIDQAWHTLLGTKHYAIWLVAFGSEAVVDYHKIQSAKQQIADPPDPNYKLHVYLTKTPVRLLDGTDEQTKIVNGLFLAGRDYADAVDTFVAANEKYLGAKEANDKYWSRIHAIEVKNYAEVSAQNLEKLIGAEEKANNFILESVGDITITKAELIAFQNKLRADGAAALPPQEINLLKYDLGGTDEDVNYLVEDILSINSSAWVDEPASIKIARAKQANQNLAKSFNELSEAFIKASVPTRLLWPDIMFITLIVAILVLIIIRHRKR